MRKSVTIRALVADDEQPARLRLLECLLREDDVDVVGVASDGDEAVKLWQKKEPDLLFLDIEMPELDGFGVLDHVRSSQLPVIVFVTAWDKYAVRAFEAHVADYLLKPFSDQRFAAALTQARKQIDDLRGHHAPRPSVGPHADAPQAKYLERIALKLNGRIIFINTVELDWIEAAGVYVNLHVGSKIYIYRSGVTSLFERLDPKMFVRLHRSVVVNTTRIRELQPRSHGDFTVVLRDGTELMMSRAHRSDLEGWLQQPI